MADGGGRFTVGVEMVWVRRREALYKPGGIRLQLETISKKSCSDTSE